MQAIMKLWQRYCAWLERHQLDSVQRSCVPLDERAQQAIERAHNDR